MINVPFLCSAAKLQQIVTCAFDLLKEIYFIDREQDHVLQALLNFVKQDPSTFSLLLDDGTF